MARGNKAAAYMPPLVNWISGFAYLSGILFCGPELLFAGGVGDAGSGTEGCWVRVRTSASAKQWRGWAEMTAVGTSDGAGASPEVGGETSEVGEKAILPALVGVELLGCAAGVLFDSSLAIYYTPNLDNNYFGAGEEK